MNHSTDIITWKMTRAQMWRLERIHSAFLGLSDMTNDHEDYSAMSLVFSPLIEDLQEIMGAIERLDPEKQLEEKGGAE